MICMRGAPWLCPILFWLPAVGSGSLVEALAGEVTHLSAFVALAVACAVSFCIFTTTITTYFILAAVAVILLQVASFDLM